MYSFLHVYHGLVGTGKAAMQQQMPQIIADALGPEVEQTQQDAQPADKTQQDKPDKADGPRNVARSVQVVVS